MASGASSGELQLGALAGIAAGMAVSGLNYAGFSAVPTRYVFSVTSALIVLLAAGFAAQAAQFLAYAGLAAVLGHTLWDSSAILPEGSLPGRVLHALVGHADRPTALQAIAYLTTILVMLGLMGWSAAGRPRPARAA